MTPAQPLPLQLRYLEALARGLAQRPDALALLALGSIGRELQRLDRFSDLDFFVVVSPGSKSHYLEDSGWLAAPARPLFHFRNTRDGFKVLWEGPGLGQEVYGECAVFEPAELPSIPFAPGRLVWSREGFDPAVAAPAPHHLPGPSSPEWLLGEALTNLYVGLARHLRGETLAALRLVQGAAVGHVLALAEQQQGAVEDSVLRDPFSIERRVERRLPALAPLLPAFCPGYGRTVEAARALLDWLEAHAPVPPDMAASLRRLLEEAG